MIREEEYLAVKKYLDTSTNLTLDQRLLKILMSRPNIGFQTIEVYFDRDPDYRATYTNIKRMIFK